ncbi:hypothetical protein [Cryobacterium sp. TMT4-31]|uniref:hypothetical protein n=1 Tax=Cryobacterium sp. TMT4-31 TaxID=1259259 RepID=UPI00106D5A7C|nr:hypothetical protein [Cryobacterium sp. TMT4-31]
MHATTSSHQPPARESAARERLIILIQETAVHIEHGYEDHLGLEDSEALADTLIANGFDRNAKLAAYPLGHCA